MDYEQLEAAIRCWCEAEAGIRAAVVVGSRAIAGQADAWSDLDVVIFVDRPEVWAAHGSWIAQLGPVWLTYRAATGAGDPEWYALFDGGLKADFVFTRAASEGTIADLMAATPYGGVFGRGARVLYAADATGWDPAPPLAQPEGATAQPTAAEFNSEVAGTLVAVNKAARLLARGEVWRAQQLIDSGLKGRLLTMMAWRAAATAEEARPDTWYEGRHVETWADGATLAALPATFGGYDRAALQAALARTLDLYGRLGREAAAAWGLAYPEAAEAKLRAWLAEV